VEANRNGFMEKKKQAYCHLSAEGTKEVIHRGTDFKSTGSSKKETRQNDKLGIWSLEGIRGGKGQQNGRALVNM